MTGGHLFLFPVLKLKIRLINTALELPDSAM